MARHTGFMHAAGMPRWSYLFQLTFLCACSSSEASLFSSDGEGGSSAESSVGGSSTSEPRGSSSTPDAGEGTINAVGGTSSGGSTGNAEAGKGGDAVTSAGSAGDTSSGTAGAIGVQPACPEKPSLKPGQSSTLELTHEGKKRSYDIHVGKSVKADTQTPLLFNFHGLNNSPQIQAQFSQMNPFADEEGFIVVYPQGVNSAFNAGPACCGSDKLDDVDFTRKILEDVTSRICVDRRRVYATGFSNGGYMSHTLACQASDIFAAIAPHSGALAIEPEDCRPTRPVPVMAVHGAQDNIVKSDAGEAAINHWVKQNGCASKPASAQKVGSRGTCTTYDECDAGVEVKFCSVANGFHFWSREPAFPASAEIWNFLSKQRL